MDAPATPTTPYVPKITIEEKLEKHKSGSTIEEWETWQRPDVGSSSGVGIAGGVYSSRDLNRVASNRLSRGITRDSVAEADEGGDDWRRDDGRKKQVFTGTTLMWYVSMMSAGLASGLLTTHSKGLRISRLVSSMVTLEQGTSPPLATECGLSHAPR